MLSASAASRWVVAALVLLAVGPAAAQDGRVVGTVTLEPRPERRVAVRYPGAGAAAPRDVEPMPAVVFIEGRVEGARSNESAELRLMQMDTSFEPSVLVVPVGATVSFPNRDPFFHNVFSYSRAKRFDLGRYPTGESREVTFDRPGVIKVFCEVHKWMRAAIVVTENPYHAVLASDGTFELTGIPAGQYRMTVWQFDRGDRTVEIDVSPGGTTRVDLAL